MAEEDRSGDEGPEGGSAGTQGQAGQFPSERWQDGGRLSDATARTPLYSAQHAERYARQRLIREYEELTGAKLIVMIDAVFAESVTYLEELLREAERESALHLLLASPGGDGEVAVRLIRALQARCRELVIIVPDMAKSAATVMCLGADRILMSPSSDLGPIDPQFPVGGGRLVGAKEIEAAVASAEERVQKAPDTYPLYAGLLADVNMLMVEQARSAMERSYSLMEEALACSGHSGEQKADLAERLRGPLVDEAKVHGATIGPEAARDLGLPVEVVDPDSPQWQTVWALWTRYFAMRCWPVGPFSVYESAKASQVIGPG